MVALCALQQTKILVAMENGPSEDVYLYVYIYIFPIEHGDLPLLC